jgi:hypothetical protein
MPVTAFAPKTCLQIANAALGELGFPQLSALNGNIDPTAVQILALLNATGEDMRDTPEGGWTSMQTEFNLIVNAPIITTGTVSVNSPVVSGIPSTAGLSAGNWAVFGAFLPSAARILNLGDQNGNNPTTTVTLTMESTGAASATPITLAQDTYSLPADMKAYIDRTWWDRTNRWALLGPDSPQLDQWHRSGIVQTGPRRHWRQIGNSLNNTYRIWPAPAELVNPIQLVFEYLSTNWVNMTGSVSSTGTNSLFTADTDTSFLDDRALIDGLKWRFKKIKGYGGWEDDRNDYIDLVDRLIGRDGGSPTISLVKRVHPFLISPEYAVQDGYFPTPGGFASN